ncbi:aminotransferase class III-fold pyridoxal phosphate-dependent enzyme [Saccharothrix sp. Mg75]|uniref:aminotransferase class III-fold pyridoxal phosphate-dependent enzyme n=1 Tax=Saccharothrix sp. Mg75 TaxID=3445357 RepID=UPI003EEEF10D
MREHAERFLGDALAAWGLDVEYDHGAGDLLHRTTDPGRRSPVLDLVGGFGSLFFGHNHPELVAHAKSLLDAGTPAHAQLSKRAEAQRVAAALNVIAERELSPGEPYSAIFANSGAEAVEAAVKHAELARVVRVGALGAEVAEHAAGVGAAAGGPDPLRLSPEAEAVAAGGGVAELLEAAGRHNAAALAHPPVFFALEGGFHGKLVGSLQLTHNPVFRVPFGGLGAHTRFVAADSCEDAVKLAEAEQPHVLDVVAVDGVVGVRRRPVPFVAAFFVEPVRGEGGITALTAEQAARITEVCRVLDCPLVVDEIQTGAGRTGAFFAGAAIGLVGDYCTLAKAVGGGLAKTSVLLVRESRYVKEFELLHSSTYAKDSFSCSITEKVLEMLERDDGAAYRRAAERGAALRAALEEVRAEYPDVVADVRGRGLLLGFEFADRSDCASPLIRDYARGGFFGFAVSGFLLRRHDLRLMPTGSAPGTLRVQPSSGIDDESVRRLAAGLRDVCDVLRHEDALHLVDPATSVGTRDFRGPGAVAAGGGTRVAFVAPLGEPERLRRFDPALAGSDDAALRAFTARAAAVNAMAPLPAVAWDPDVAVSVFPLLVGPHLSADAVAAGVAGQVAAARGAGFDVVVVSGEFTGSSASGRGPAGFALPPGFGDEVPAELAAALTG